MKILGISALYHDSAAALLDSGVVVAAAQEERFTRKKHDSRIPISSIEFCLKSANCKLEDVDAVAFYDKPFLKFERLLETYLATAPYGFQSFRKALPLWVKEKLFQKKLLIDELKKLSENVNWEEKLLFSEHHLSHAASAFFPSPFESAAILTMDGVGEWTTTSLAIGNGSSIEISKEIHFPHSIGLLYSAFTYFTGFKVNSGEYKVMGLAPYGVPKFKDLILKEVVDLKADGSFRLNMKYFDYCTGLTMTNKHMEQLLGVPVRKSEETLGQVHMDIAASVQAVTEEVVLRLANSIARETGQKNLCLAGGVALNCVANGKLQKARIFENIWVQPAAGDAGGALGAAFAAYHLNKKQSRKVSNSEMDMMKGSYLGPSYDSNAIENELKKLGAKFEKLSDDQLFSRTTESLSQGKAVGWMQGRMEFGPRALGARSIIADPRSPSTQSVLNLKVKFRESFRPFAPAVLEEKVSEWFEFESDSPYMLMVANVKESKCRVPSASEEALQGIQKLQVPRSEIPAVTHVDYSARIQTVSEKTNPRFHRLLRNFDEKTGCPVLVNTSFNVRGEPIVNTPSDAFRCFMGTNIEVLVIENYFLRKEDQDPALFNDYKHMFELD